MIQVIAALGNPGREYAATRHNAGWLLLDTWVAQMGGSWKAEAKFKAEVAVVMAGSQKVLCVKPQTFMNLSGEAVQPLLHFYKIQPADLLLVHDEVAFDSGVRKLTWGGSGGGHNGVASVIERLGTADFARLRLGVGPRHPDATLAEWVLGPLGQTEQDLIKKMVGDLRLIVDNGFQKAQNCLNQHISNHEQQPL